MTASLHPASNYDAILVVSFGGPESREEVIPFLENVLRGRNVPRERMLAVAEHYYHFGGKESHQPADARPDLRPRKRTGAARSEIARLLGQPQLASHAARYLAADETFDGIHRALAFVTSAYSSYSGCRQYREDIARAQNEIGPDASAVDKLRVPSNHPGFIAAIEERMRGALREIPESARQNVQVIYTAHSIPMSMANTSDYVLQLEEVRRLLQKDWESRTTLSSISCSGAPGQPWLEPDILDHLREVKARDLASAVVLAPIGFISDHMEVLYDLDVEARQLCVELQLPMVRAKTVGVHPKFITMIRELIVERMNPEAERRALGSLGPRQDVCAQGCCPAPQRPVRLQS